MLYTIPNMNSQTNIPGEMVIGDREFSLQRSWKLNTWLVVAAAISALCDVIYSPVVRQWPVAWRLAVVLVPFVALALWVRSLARWIRGMDELQRRITISTFLFAVSGTLLYILLWFRLEVTGLFEAIIGQRLGWGMGTVSFGILTFSVIYGVGHRIFTRRYQ
jgi:hypothetical protein